MVNIVSKFQHIQCMFGMLSVDNVSLFVTAEGPELTYGRIIPQDTMNQ